MTTRSHAVPPPIPDSHAVAMRRGEIYEHLAQLCAANGPAEVLWALGVLLEDASGGDCPTLIAAADHVTRAFEALK